MTRRAQLSPARSAWSALSFQTRDRFHARLVPGEQLKDPDLSVIAPLDGDGVDLDSEAAIVGDHYHSIYPYGYRLTS